MLSSSADYLKALRNENYLLFLEWPNFVAKLYKEDEKRQGVDALVPLLVSEWLNNGFCGEDVKKVALLVQVSKDPSKPLRCDLEYSLTTIVMIVLQCLVYKDLLPLSVSGENKTVAQIVHSYENLKIDRDIVNENLKKEEHEFSKLVIAADKAKVEESTEAINAIAQLRYNMEEYLENLEASGLQQINTEELGALKIARISVVKTLLKYLNEQTQFTSAVKSKVSNFITKIRDLGATDSEERYLMPIVPLSISQQAWRMISKIGSHFFKLLPENSSKTNMLADEPFKDEEQKRLSQYNKG